MNEIIPRLLTPEELARLMTCHMGQMSEYDLDLMRCHIAALTENRDERDRAVALEAFKMGQASVGWNDSRYRGIPHPDLKEADLSTILFNVRQAQVDREMREGKGDG